MKVNKVLSVKKKGAEAAGHHKPQKTKQCSRRKVHPNALGLDAHGDEARDPRQTTALGLQRREDLILGKEGIC